MDVEIWMPRKAEFWDVKGIHLKTLVVKDIRKVSGIWTSHKLHVTNHKNQHQTIITSASVDYITPIDDSIFSEEALINGY